MLDINNETVVNRLKLYDLSKLNLFTAENIKTVTNYLDSVINPEYTVILVDLSGKIQITSSSYDRTNCLTVLQQHLIKISHIRSIEDMLYPRPNIADTVKAVLNEVYEQIYIYYYHLQDATISELLKISPQDDCILFSVHDYIDYIISHSDTLDFIKNGANLQMFQLDLPYFIKCVLVNYHKKFFIDSCTTDCIFELADIANDTSIEIKMLARKVLQDLSQPNSTICSENVDELTQGLVNIINFASLEAGHTIRLPMRLFASNCYVADDLNVDFYFTKHDDFDDIINQINNIATDDDSYNSYISKFEQDNINIHVGKYYQQIAQEIVDLRTHYPNQVILMKIANLLETLFMQNKVPKDNERADA